MVGWGALGDALEGKCSLLAEGWAGVLGLPLVSWPPDSLRIPVHLTSQPSLPWFPDVTAPQEVAEATRVLGLGSCSNPRPVGLLGKSALAVGGGGVGSGSHSLGYG